MGKLSAERPAVSHWHFGSDGVVPTREGPLGSVAGKSASSQSSGGENLWLQDSGERGAQIAV